MTDFISEHIIKDVNTKFGKNHKNCERMSIYYNAARLLFQSEKNINSLWSSEKASLICQLAKKALTKN